MLAVDPVFSEGPGFYSAPPPCHFPVAAVAPSVSSHSQAWWNCEQGTQNIVQAVPAPAPAKPPVWLQGPTPDPVGTPDFTELRSP